jgi:predicted DNA-binding transcriptional regulator AlpA
MSSSSPVCASERDQRDAKSAARVQRTLELFPSLPDDALVETAVYCALRSRSRASHYRDLKEGRIPPPVRVGARSTRWRVGDVRASLRASPRHSFEAA